MGAPQYTVDDMAGALHALMPPGAAWPRDVDSVQHKTLRGLAASFARSAGRAQDLLIDAFPATSYELLPQWEATLGLPGLCGTHDITVQDRQRSVVAALTDQGGQGAPNFLAVASALGYAVSITEFKTHSVLSPVDEPLRDAQWALTWQVNGAAYRVSQFDVKSQVDAPLTSWDNFLLGCVFQRSKPANTTVIFNNT